MKYLSMKIKIVFWIALVALLQSGCDTLHGDRMEQIGARVEKLEEMVLDFNNQLAQLQVIVNTIHEHGYITQIVQNADGSYALRMSTGQTVTLRNGERGKDGTAKTLDMNAKEDADGNWYWTLNGDWLLGEDGKKIRVNPTDGQDDVNLALALPQVRVNATTGNWELSTDGGTSWSDMGVRAIGRDGKDDIFYACSISADGTKVTITLSDGREFTFPVKSEA